MSRLMPKEVNKEQMKRIQDLNTAARYLEYRINELCPKGRERKIALQWLGMVYIVCHYLCPLIHFSCLAAVPAVAKFFKLACRFASSNLYCSVFHSLNALQIAWQPILLTSHPLQGDLPTIFSCSPLPLPVCRLYAPALQSLLCHRS